MIWLLIEVWSVFGIWNLVLGGVISFVGTFIASVIGSKASSRHEHAGKITYNPAEWPMYMALVLGFSGSGYLYWILDQRQAEGTILGSEFTFGIAYIVISGLLPGLNAIRNGFKNRNDYVEISEHSVMYKDNETSETFALRDIASAEGGINITLTMKDGSTSTIPTSNMNFGSDEVRGAVRDITSRISSNA
jgi:hypothetical protein